MIDTVDALVKSTLAALCPNVARLLYRGKAGTFFTYQLVLSQDRDAAEDEMQGRNIFTALTFIQSGII